MRAYPSPAYRYPSPTLRAYQRALAGLSVILAVVIACLAATGGFLNPSAEAPAVAGEPDHPAAATPSATAAAAVSPANATNPPTTSPQPATPAVVDPVRMAPDAGYS